MASEIEASGQPFPRRDKEQRSSFRRELAEVIDRRLERPGVRRRPVTNAAELRHRRAVGPAVHGQVLKALYYVTIVMLLHRSRLCNHPVV